MLSLASLLAVALAAPSLPSLRVATLSKHDPTAWSEDDCVETSPGQAACNLRVYAAATAAAAAQNASLMVFPEGYGLTSAATKKGAFEACCAAVGSTPYLTSSNETSPQQVALSRMAEENGIAISANIFGTRTDGHSYIVEIVFSEEGVVLASYEKHHLFVTEEICARPSEPSPRARAAAELHLV